MAPAFYRFILTKILRWHIPADENSRAPEDKVIFVMAPHTSAMDFIIGYLYYRAVGGRLRTMVKKEMFNFPLGHILRHLGAFPIDRSNSQEVLVQLIHTMNQEGVFHLAICPEGTRKAVRKWKTGYHMIAKETGAPVYLAHLDYRTRTVGRGQKMVLSDDARADTERMQTIYEDMHLTARHPEGYMTH